MNRPPRGYSWPQAGPGNHLATKHGAGSPRTVEPVAAAFVAQALGSAAYLSDPSYRPAVERWAVAEAKGLLLERYLERVGDLDEEGRPRPALDALRLWQKRASEEADRLGLTPLARARLGRDVAGAQVDLASLWAELSRREEESNGAC